MTRILNFITLRKQLMKQILKQKQVIEKYNADAKAKYEELFVVYNEQKLNMTKNTFEYQTN